MLVISATPKASGAASRRRGAAASLRSRGVTSLPELSAFEDAFKTSPTPTLLVQEGRLQRINRAARRLLGGRPSVACLSSFSNASESPPRGERTITSHNGQFIATRVASRPNAPVQVWHLSRPQRPRLDIFRLTVRERCVMSFLVNGMTDAEIGRELSVSVLTVHKHVAHILGKTGVHSRTKLAALVLKSE